MTDSHVGEPAPLVCTLFELDPVFGECPFHGRHCLSSEFDGSDEDEDLVGLLPCDGRMTLRSRAEEGDQVGT